MIHRKTKILVVDDEPAMREVLELLLQDWGYEVRSACDGTQGKELAESYDPDIVVTDVVMPQASGLELLRSLKGDKSDRPVILVTAQGSIDMAVEAMKQGALDFVTKPLDYEKFKAILEVAQRDIELRQESRKLTSQLEKGAGFGDFVGTSKGMREVYDVDPESGDKRRFRHRDRGKRNRERTGCANHSQPQRAIDRPLRCHKRCRYSGKPDGERDLRS